MQDYDLEDESTALKTFKDAIDTLVRRKPSALRQWANDVRLMNYAVNIWDPRLLTFVIHFSFPLTVGIK